MRKSYIIWMVLASYFTLMFIVSLIRGTLGGIEGAGALLLIIAVLWFVSYRRFREYHEWRIEYESNLKKNEAVTNAANAYTNSQNK